jgi:short-subunit dehydrogenase
MVNRDLHGMIVAISGASAGIGEALARELARRGACLSLCARRLEKLEALNGELGGNHLIVRADVSTPKDCDAFIAQTLSRFGRIDTLVCNAGYGLYRLAAEFTSDEMRRIFATNVFGTTGLIRAAVPSMRKQPPREGWRGQIMIVSSAAARRGVPYLGPYSATKAAQLSIAEALRVELRPDRIAVTSVHPIMTSTDFGRVAETSGDVKLPRHVIGAHQSVEHVVGDMLRAIRRPRPEVWPHELTRWGLIGAMMLPRLADRVMSRYRRQVAEFNRSAKDQVPQDPHSHR